MATAVDIVFSPGGKVYSFDANGLELRWNERVVCQTSRGLELGRVVRGNRDLDSPPAPALKKVVRRATETDLETAAQNRLEARRALRAFREATKTVGANVKVVAADLVLDGSRLVFSYQAEGRPDLAPLEAELRERIERRVELRSVGPRECARLCGDVGLCGYEHCSRRFPSHEQPITLRMAKDQGIPPTSGRITGLCGRLRCCLAFEHPVYRSFRDRAPRVGRRVDTPSGLGVVTGYEVLKDACAVELEDGTALEVPIDECRELERA